MAGDDSTYTPTIQPYAGVRSDPDPQHRSVKQYAIHDTELVSMTLQTGGASLAFAIGWKCADIWLSTTPTTAAEKTMVNTIGVIGLLTLVYGVLLLGGFGVIVRAILHQSGQTLRGVIWQKIAIPGPKKKKKARTIKPTETVPV